MTCLDCKLQELLQRLVDLLLLDLLQRLQKLKIRHFVFKEEEEIQSDKEEAEAEDEEVEAEEDEIERGGGICQVHSPSVQGSASNLHVEQGPRGSFLMVTTKRSENRTTGACCAECAASPLERMLSASRSSKTYSLLLPAPRGLDAKNVCSISMLHRSMIQLNEQASFVRAAFISLLSCKEPID